MTEKELADLEASISSYVATAERMDPEIVRKLLVEVRRLRGLILSIEWEVDGDGGGYLECCPWCLADKSGHDYGNHLFNKANEHAHDCPAFSAAGVLR